MVRLRCCGHWLHEDCLSKSVLDGCCPTCKIWLASFDDALVLAGAASAGDVQKVKELLEKQTCCTAQDYYGRTPLHSAVLGEHREVVRELLDHGVDTSATDSKGQTALHLAAQRYSPAILGLLLDRGADLYTRDHEDMTPLHFTCGKGVTKMIDCLVEKGAKRDAENKYGLTPEMLHPSSTYSDSMRLLSCIARRPDLDHDYNHITRLDEALIRPGRMDKKFELGLADKEMTADLFRLVFKPMECDIALLKSTQSDVLVGSGKNTKVHEAAMILGEEVKRVEQLAEEFAAKVPELEFSPAEILSFLMGYRQSPRQPIDNVEIWMRRRGAYLVV